MCDSLSGVDAGEVKMTGQTGFWGLESSLEELSAEMTVSGCVQLAFERV